VGGTSGCFRAKRLWFEDFETGDYDAMKRAPNAVSALRALGGMWPGGTPSWAAPS
jgi:hypothetical protein